MHTTQVFYNNHAIFWACNLKATVYDTLWLYMLRLIQEIMIKRWRNINSFISLYAIENAAFNHTISYSFHLYCCCSKIILKMFTIMTNISPLLSSPVLWLERENFLKSHIWLLVLLFVYRFFKSPPLLMSNYDVANSRQPNKQNYTVIHAGTYKSIWILIMDYIILLSYQTWFRNAPDTIVAHHKNTIIYTNINYIRLPILENVYAAHIRWH